MDISDKNFKPCPCGYQICQFCYNNIRQNPELNGRCPGCRRLYDDESVEYKTLSSEEYKTQQLKKEKREREKKQREKERKELEIASKKHLAGLRVVQKNLVYVTGLNPPCPPEDLHVVLRSDKYFGQYGKILKIVINRKTPAGHPAPVLNQSIVVYVTFTRKEDALRCINELDGLLCDGRVLRAAHGTTKYCLLYLRGHPCPNPNCMFLHEPGEEADSYTRKDLSTQQGIKMGMRTGSGVDLHYFGEEDELEDDHVLVQPLAASGSSSNAGAPVSAAPVSAAGTPVAGHVPVLPATAHWAKAQPESTAASPQAAAALANTAAFPALSEIFKEQKLAKKDGKKKKARDNVLPDDIDVDDHLAAQYAGDTGDRLRALAASRRSLQVYLDDLDDAAASLPLFHYDSAVPATCGMLDDERMLARLLIERFLLRPIKKYHLAYLNHPVSQQQQLLTQQVQMQHAQAQMALDPAALHPSYQQQLFLMQLQQGQHAPPGAPPAAAAAGKAHPQLSAQLNALRMSDRSRTATPPPPGLFGKHTEAVPAPPMQESASSSSQLLTQLMSGKK